MQQSKGGMKVYISKDDLYGGKGGQITFEHLYLRALMTLSSLLNTMYIRLNEANGQMENNLKDDYLFKMIMEFTKAAVNSDSLGSDKQIKDKIRLLYTTDHPRYGVRLIDLFHMMFKAIKYYYTLGPRLRRSNCSTRSPNIAVDIVYECLQEYSYGVDEIRIKNLKKIYVEFKKAYGMPSIFDEERDR